MPLGAAAPTTRHEMRAHFTRCPNRPAVSPPVNHRDERSKNGNAKRGRPPGPRMRCGWDCGAQLTGRQVRAHFTICAKRPAGSDHVDSRERNLNLALAKT